MTKAKRFNYISDTKAVCLLGVILFHCMLFYADNPFFPERADFISKPVVVICSILDSTVVEGFVFCSGFLYVNSAFGKSKTVFQDIYSKVRRLIVPYLLMGTFWLVPLYTFFDITTFGRTKGMGYLEGYKYMLLGVFSDHLWFLLMLFWVSVIFILMKPLILDKKFLPISGAVTLAAAFLVKFPLSGFPYYKFNQIPPYLLCYYLGICAWHFRDKLEALPAKADLLISALLFPLTVFYNDLSAKSFVWGWICRSAGAVMMLFIFLGFYRLNISERLGKKGFWLYMQRHSFYLYLFNLPFSYLFFRLFYPLVGHMTFLCILLNFIMCMLAQCTIVQILNRLNSYRKELLGKSDKKKE